MAVATPGEVKMLEYAGSPANPTALRDLFTALEMDPGVVNKVLKTPEGFHTTLLYTAIRADNHKAVATLVKMGADCNLKVWNGNTALLVGCYRGHWRSIDQICWVGGAKGPDLSIRNDFGENWEVFAPNVDAETKARIRSMVNPVQWYYLKESKTTKCPSWAPLVPQPAPNAQGVQDLTPTLKADFGSMNVLDKTSGIQHPMMRLERYPNGAVGAQRGKDVRHWVVPNPRHHEVLPFADCVAIEKHLQSTATAAQTHVAENQLKRGANFYEPRWFWRDEDGCWQAQEAGMDRLLELAYRCGRDSHKANIRDFDVRNMTSTERATGETVKMLHVADGGADSNTAPLPFDTIQSLNPDIAARLEWCARPHSDVDLKDFVKNRRGPLAMAYINYVLNHIGAVVKGGAIRDIVVLGLTTDCKDLDCELPPSVSVMTWKKTADGWANELKSIFEFQSVTVGTRKTLDPFQGKRGSEACHDAIITIDCHFKASPNPTVDHPDLELELVTPWCKGYWPPRNVDMSQNNLYMMPREYPPGLHQSVWIPWTTREVLINTIERRAAPVYDVKWTPGGKDGWARNKTVEACAPTDFRHKVMQKRVDKAREKGFQLVEWTPAGRTQSDCAYALHL